MVTHHPSAAILCTEAAPCAAQVSQLVTGDSRYEHSDSNMHVLRKLHVSAQLMEDFLEIARNNTDKDVETCGVLGASLVNPILDGMAVMLENISSITVTARTTSAAVFRTAQIVASLPNVSYQK